MPPAKVVDQIRDAVVAGATAVHAQTSPAAQQHRVEAERAHMDRMESELAPLVTGLRDAFAGGGDVHGAFSALLDAAAAPEHAALLGLQQALLFGFVLPVFSELLQPFLAPLVQQSWTLLPTLPLSPEAAALNVLRGFSSEADGAVEAARSGASADTFHQILQNQGEPPGLEEMLLLWRRDQATTEDLDRAIRESRIRPEWIPFVHSLRYAPPSASVAIAAAVQGHLTPEESSAKAAEAGSNPDNWQWLYDTAGRPPGTQQMLGLLNRQLVDEATVIASIRESDVKDKYIPALLNLRRHLMPQRTVVSAVHQGVLDVAGAVAKLQEIGYSPEDAALLASEGASAAVGGAKHVAAGMVETAYQDRMLDRGGALEQLTALGYSAEQAGFMLDVRDASRAYALEAQAVAVIRGGFVRRKLDSGAAVAELDRLGIPGTQRDDLLLTWTIERDSSPRELSLAELNWAVGAGQITPADYSARVLGMGYDAADTALLLAHHGPAAL